MRPLAGAAWKRFKRGGPPCQPSVRPAPGSPMTRWSAPPARGQRQISCPRKNKRSRGSGGRAPSAAAAGAGSAAGSGAAATKAWPSHASTRHWSPAGVTISWRPSPSMSTSWLGQSIRAAGSARRTCASAYSTAVRSSGAESTAPARPPPVQSARRRSTAVLAGTKAMPSTASTPSTRTARASVHGGSARDRSSPDPATTDRRSTTSQRPSPAVASAAVSALTASAPSPAGSAAAASTITAWRMI